MTHLTPDELVDAVEDALTPERREHLSICPACRRAVDELDHLLRVTQNVSVPEPSPLFWTHFAMRVREAIASERSAGIAAGWQPWAVVAPIAGLVVLVTVLALAISRDTDTTAGRAPSDEVLFVSEDPYGEAEDPPWLFVTDVVGYVDLDEAEQAGLVIGPDATDRAITELSTDERRELFLLLQAELARAGS